MRIQFGNNNLNNRRMGQTIEERMKEYNEFKNEVQDLKKNKDVYKKNSNNELARTPWWKVILVALVCILMGALAMYAGINSARRTIANHDDREYTRAEITHITFGPGSYETRLEVEYEVDGKTYEANIDTNKDRNEFMRGQTIGVYYYKDNPSRIYETASEVGGFAAPVVGAIFIIVGFAAIFAKIKAGNVKRKK